MTGIETIILCGGSAKRMKPFLPFNKALAEVQPGKTLLEYQLDWLKKHNVSSITLAINKETYDTVEEKTPHILDKVQTSIEYEKLGTGGAVKKAVNMINDSVFYLMNVDDIITSEQYTPTQLINKAQQGGALLLATTTFPFGVVETNEQYITGFKQKPSLPYWINTGHYALTTQIVKQKFPEKGNFEDNILPKLTENKQLQHHKLEGEWITINNIKQLDQAKQRLSEIQNSAKPN